MSSRKLPNYLRSNRKRLVLSQDQAAFLLGTKKGPKVSRYENFLRVPHLETALAFEAIYQKPVNELFAGLYEEIQRQVAMRAQALIDGELKGKTSREAGFQRESLSHIISQLSSNEQN